MKATVFITVAVLYALNRSRYAGFHDSLSFLEDALRGFNPATNATSHLLYNNVQAFLVRALDIIPPVAVLTWFSILSALAALYLFYRLGHAVTGDAHASLLGVPVLAFSFTFWQQAGMIEVYAFHSVFYVAFVWIAWLALEKQSARHLFLASLLLGVALLVHIQNILAFPFFLWLLWKILMPGWKKTIALLIPPAFLLLLVLLPAFTHTNPIQAVFTDRQFGSKLWELDLRVLWKGPLLALAFLLYNFHLFLVPAWQGIRGMDIRKQAPLWVLAVPGLLFGMKFLVPDNHVFFIPTWIILCIFIVQGISRILSRGLVRYGIAVVLTLSLSPLIYATVARGMKTSGVWREYDQAKAYKGGVYHLFWPGHTFQADPLALAKVYPADTTLEWNLFAAQEVNRMLDASGR